MIKFTASEANEVTSKVFEEKYKIDQEIYDRISELIKKEANKGNSELLFKISDYFDAPESFKEYNENRGYKLCHELWVAGYIVQPTASGDLRVTWSRFKK